MKVTPDGRLPVIDTLVAAVVVTVNDPGMPTANVAAAVLVKFGVGVPTTLPVDTYRMDPQFVHS
jgi:hypothetical protein